MEAAKSSCITEKSADKDAVEAAEKGHFKDGDNLNCFAECVFKKVNFIKDDGTANVEAMKAAAKEEGGADEAKHMSIVEKCATKTGKDACDTSHNIFRCYWEEMNA